RGGAFLPLFTRVATPFLSSFSVLVAVAISYRTKARSSLQNWLILSVLTLGLDEALNAFSPGRNTLSWYFGKFETLLTASIVLIALPTEINVSYRRLSKMAMIDPLTGIHNRRGFRSNLQSCIDKRGPGTSFALLMIDI